LAERSGPAEPREAVAIIGGTGDQGLGLALRFAAAGRRVVIGSRKQERADAAAAAVRERFGASEVTGLDNAAAVRAVPGGIVVLSVPFEHTVGTLASIEPELTTDQVLVSMGVPLASAVGDVAARMLGVSQGSCAELCQARAPQGVAVVSAFQNVSARRLSDLDQPVECDVVVSGERPARLRVMRLCEDLPGTRAIDGGPLYNARYVEAMTALLIGINIRYRCHEGAGIRFTHV